MNGIGKTMRMGLWLGVVAAVLSATMFATFVSAASAQDIPDARQIPPRILLALDSSGSMERKVCQCTHPETCVCATGETGCEDCRMTASDCAPSSTGPVRNRMQTLVEVLTGTFYDKTGVATYACSIQARTAGNGYLTSYPDYGYSVDHVLYNGPVAPATSMLVGQNDDGVLDTYEQMVEFALMTFDSESTLHSDGLLASTIAGPPLWDASYGVLTTKMAGGFSYGEDKSFTFPGCADTYKTNSGAKSFQVDGWPAITAGGAHFGVGPLYPFAGRAATTNHVAWVHTRENAPGAGSTESFDTFGGIPTPGVSATSDLQAEIQTLRPYGSTPIAGVLDDVRYFYGAADGNAHDNTSDPLNDQAGDPDKDSYGNCRDNYLILMTDGIGNLDFRGYPFYCENSDTCPYETPEVIISDLISSGKVKKVYIIGFNLPDDSGGQNAALDALESYALAGGTTLYTPSTGDDLKAVFSEIISETLHAATSRTLPAFATGYSSSGTTQAQFNSGFRVGEAGDAWSGVLDRRRYVCDGSSPELATPDPAVDDFAALLDLQRGTTEGDDERHLYTVVPSAAANVAGWLGSDTLPSAATGFPALGITASPGITGPTETSLSVVDWFPSTPVVTPAMLGVATTTDRDKVQRWVKSFSASGDVIRPAMADIFHSTPAIVRNPTYGVIDPGFDYFRENLLIQQDGSARPDMMYFATNDGVLHAIVSDDWRLAATGADDPDGDGMADEVQAPAGHELWGFIPPATFPKLNSATVSRTVVFDGAPIVKDVQLARVPGEAESNQRYHSILLIGMRDGGNSYIAMDVTNPLGSDTNVVASAKPTFLWQFTAADMGRTYGQPGITEAIIDTDGLGSNQRRAIAILPGGMNSDSNAGVCPAVDAAYPAAPEVGDSHYPSGDPSPKTARAGRPCWTATGRGLYIVDISTGTLLRKWDHVDCGGAPAAGATCLMSPMVGDVSVFPSEIGTVATSAYMTDADGILWRLDLSSTDPDDWSLQPLHDVFSNDIVNSNTTLALTAAQAARAGKPSFGAPLISVNDNGDPIIIIATGDLDSLDNSTEINRVVSLTELYNSTTAKYEATVNWEVTMQPGEQVTGPLQLFDSGVYYSTFITATSTTDACEFGYSRLCGLHYLETTPDATDPALAPLGVLRDSGGDLVTCEGDETGPYLNQVINGVAITQRPTCYTQEDFTSDCGNGMDCLSSKTKQLTDYTVGDVQLVALVGGDGQAISGGGSSLNEINKTLDRPSRNVTALSWLGSAY